MSLTRRQFLGLTTAETSSDDSPHAIVCVFLRGGADTLNLVVPYTDDDYYRARPSLAIPPPTATAGSAVALDARFAFHPRLSPLVPAFREGRLAVVQAVGSDNTSGSHFEAQDQMEHGAGEGATVNGGWIGRYLRVVAADAATPLAAVAIGTTLPESMRGASAASVIQSVDEIGLRVPAGEVGRITAALDALYGSSSELLRGPGVEALRLLSRVEELKASAYVPANGAQYPDGPFGSGMREIARLVRARVGLRVACIDLEGWDTHFVQGSVEGLQADLIDMLGRGLAAFDSDIAGERDRVTVVVMTEFGRRIYENSSSGTDHGRGFSMLALGGRIRGGTVLGDWPGLDQEEGPIGPGGVRVLVDYRSILSEVLMGAAGLRDPSRVFTGFQPRPVGIVA